MLKYLYNYKKRHSAGTLIKLIIQQLFLVILAYIATLNIFMSLMLNLIVPFWLIFSKASPFNQLGYFSSLMTFTFMQLMHMDRNGFSRQFTAMFFCCGAFFIAALFYTRVRKEPAGSATEQKSIKLAGTILGKAVIGKPFETELKELSTLQRELYQEAYFLLILRQSKMKDQDIIDTRWKIPLKQRLKKRILYRLRPDTFEMRFALRMSLVLTAGMTFNFLFSEGHSYWFVMNAFLLLRPMYEDSNYRIKTRFLGTAAGCILVSLLLPSTAGVPAHLLIAGLMVVCMYTATPGTISHAVFVTCFALSMTTLTMGVTAEAAFLRLILSSPLDYWRLCDAQLQYHMVHAQIRKELPKSAKNDEGFYLDLLSITWRMASEIQQMFFHVTHKKRSLEARHVILRYIYYTDHILDQIQEMLHLRREKYQENIEGMQYQRYVEGEPKLSQLMTLYAHNLYAVVSKKIQT